MAVALEHSWFESSVVLQTLASTGFLVSVGCVVVVFILWKLFHDPLRKIPKPEHSLIFGHALQLREHPDIFVLLEKWYEQFKGDGLYRIDLKLDSERVVIIDPELARQILVTNASKYYRAATLKEFFKTSSDGLFLSNGALHAYQRKLLSPMFSYGTVVGFLPIFRNHTAALVELWKKKIHESEDGVIEAAVYDDLNHVALDIIGQSAFGYEFNSVAGTQTKLQTALDTIFAQRVSFKMRLLKRIVPFLEYLPSAGNRRLKEGNLYIKTLLEELVMTNKASLSAEAAQDSDSKTTSLSLMKLLLMAQKDGNAANMPDARVSDNVFTFLFAGHETTATSLMWTLYLLAQHQDVQQRAFDEVTSVFKDSEDDEITSEAVEKLEYIACIIKESLRLYPAAPIVMRVVHEEDTLASYVVPKGTVIMMDILSMQRSEDLWENAKSFIPDRFYRNDSDEYKKTSAFRYFPFTAGPRSCIGRRFALMEMKVVLASLLRNFHFDIDPDHPPVERRQTITMKAAPVPRLKLTLR